MNLPYAYSPNIWPSVIAFMLVIGLAIFSFRHRDVPGALPFFIAVMISLLWCLGLLCEYMAVGIDLKIFWRKFQVIFQLPSATAITCFLLEYAWPKRWLTRRNLILLSIMPLLVVLLVITNHYHQLFWEGFDFDGSLMPIPGPLMKYFIAYIFVNFLMNMIIFVWLFIHSPQNRLPVVIMVLGQIMMRLLFFFDLANRALANIRFTPVGIAITSSLYALVFFRFRIIGPIPMAREAVIKQLPIGTIILDDRETVHSLNPAAEGMLQMTTKAARGLNVRKILPVYPQNHLSEDLAESIEFSQDFEGKKRHYTLSISILRDWRKLQVGQMLLITDVTEQKKIQARVLEQGRVLATMKEREQLAKELHDDLAQVFAFIDTQGQTIRRLLNRGNLATADTHLARLIEAAREGEVDIRESIRAMRLTLSEHGLLTTLKNYLLQFEANTSIQTDLITSDDFDNKLLDPMMEVQLLRILQEALTNIRKHANASNVWIKFDVMDSSVCVNVQDNGLGFDFEANDLRETNHFGLALMRERAESVGGKIQMHSQPGQGTEIFVCVPISSKSVET